MTDLRSDGRRQRPQPSWSATDTARAAEMWQAGRTAAEIAGALGKSRNAVLGKIGRLGLNRIARTCHAVRPRPGQPRRGSALPKRLARPPSRWSHDHQARLMAYWADGLSPDEIAVRLGCQEATVIRRAAGAGLTSVEAPERHAGSDWFARNDARFRAAMRRALDRGLVRLPEEGVAHGD